MAAIVPGTVDVRFYEEIRDRIAAIILTEVPPQGTLRGDTLIEGIDKIYIERSVPFSKENMPAINVLFDKVEEEIHTQTSKQFSAVYFVDVYGSISEKSTSRADETSAKFVQTLSGLIDGIISYGGYVRLGFPVPTAANPEGVAQRSVFEIQNFNPEKTKDAQTMVRSRVKIRVIGTTVEQADAPKTLEGLDTFLLLDGNGGGYTLSTSPGVTPPVPICPPGEIRDSAATVIGSAPSGGFGVVSDSNVSNSDDSFSVNVLATQSLEVPDSNVSNSDDSFSVDLPATIDLELPDSNVSNSDDSFSVDVPATTDLELPDTDYRIFFNGVLQQSFSEPSIIDLTINITL